MSGGSLRRRVVAVIIMTTIATSLLFGLMTFIFAYSLEDRLFENELAGEIARQQAIWQEQHRLVPPIKPYIRIYRAGMPLPADLLPQMVAEPSRKEFSGKAGRHYHVARFELPGPTGGPAMAVAEGSRYLLVRPVRDSLILFLAALSLVTALFAALIGWWLAARALAPLDRLTAALANVGSGVPRINGGGFPANEIGVLARSLSEAFDRIRGFVEREQAFTRDASHELRTPLAVIRGAAELMATDPATPASLMAPLRRIETASGDMLQALDLLLTLAREQTPLPNRGAEVLPLVEKALAYASARFSTGPETVTVDVSPLAAVPVDATLLQLVLNNLVGNAFQHAAMGDLRISGDAARLQIVDSGPGLRDIGGSFAPFHKGPESTGSGLGLAIVERLCAATNIMLSCRAMAGGGTLFQLDFIRAIGGQDSSQAMR